MVLVTTGRHGQANVMAMSWHMMMEFDPPLVACVVSNRGYSFTALHETGECVIAIPSVELVETVVKVGNSSGRDTDKFKEFGLSALPAHDVAPPLIAECFANLECKVIDRTLVERYSTFILQVVKAWIDPTREGAKTIHHHGYGRFVVDGETVTLPSRMP